MKLTDRAIPALMLAVYGLFFGCTCCSIVFVTFRVPVTPIWAIGIVVSILISYSGYRVGRSLDVAQSMTCRGKAIALAALLAAIPTLTVAIGWALGVITLGHFLGGVLISFVPSGGISLMYLQSLLSDS